MPIFTGINNRAQNVEKIFIGVNGKAKEVKAAFVGVNGKAKQAYTDADAAKIMKFDIGSGTFRINVTGENIRLVINGVNQTINSGKAFTKSISSIGTAKLSATKITDISFTGNTALRSVKSAFPKSSEYITTFYNCFSYCTSLTSIPEDLFDNNTAVTSFSNCFYNCSSLTSIPEGLFDSNTAATLFGFCFYNCSRLTSIPEGLFDSNTAVTSFSNCFCNCSSLTSNVPTLWDTTKWPTVNVHELCFRGCTSAANYADIPSGWK